MEEEEFNISSARKKRGLEGSEQSEERDTQGELDGIWKKLPEKPKQEVRSRLDAAGSG